MLRYTVSQKNCGLPKYIASPKPKTKTNIIKVYVIAFPFSATLFSTLTLLFSISINYSSFPYSSLSTIFILKLPPLKLEGV